MFCNVFFINNLTTYKKMTTDPCLIPIQVDIGNVQKKISYSRIKINIK